MITIDMVKKAYEKTGFIIVSNMFLTEIEDGFCACPLTALFFAEHEDILQSLKAHDKIINYLILDWGKEKFGQQYMYGFIYGFDGKDIFHYDVKEPEYFTGYNTGVSLRNYFNNNCVLPLNR